MNKIRKFLKKAAIMADVVKEELTEAVKDAREMSKSPKESIKDFVETVKNPKSTREDLVGGAKEVLKKTGSAVKEFVMGDDEDVKKVVKNRTNLKTYGDKFFTEKTPVDPRSPYSASKTGADHIVIAYGETYKLPINITRCSNNYGPYQNPEKFIPRQITNLLTGQQAVLYGAGLNIRDWIHVKDHCRAIDTIIDKGVIGETYLIGVNNERTNIEVLQKILLQLGKSQEDFKYIADRPGHDLRYGIDASKLYTELGFTPLYVDFDKGLKEVIHWYQDHEDWWQEMIAQKQDAK